MKPNDTFTEGDAKHFPPTEFNWGVAHKVVKSGTEDARRMCMRDELSFAP